MGELSQTRGTDCQVHTRKGQEDWERKSLPGNESNNGCGELERETGSQEVTNSLKGGVAGESKTAVLMSSSNLEWAWETSEKSRVTF